MLPFSTNRSAKASASFASHAPLARSGAATAAAESALFSGIRAPSGIVRVDLFGPVAMVPRGRGTGIFSGAALSIVPRTGRIAGEERAGGTCHDEFSYGGRRNSAAA